VENPKTREEARARVRNLYKKMGGFQR